MTESDRDEMMESVQCIQVGNAYFAVEFEGEPVPMVSNLTEQCEGCGAHGDYALDQVGDEIDGVLLTRIFYACLGCDQRYFVVRRPAEDVVF